MARLIKSEVVPNISMVSNFIHDDESIEKITCKVGDKVTVKYVQDGEVAEVTGIVDHITLTKDIYRKGDKVVLFDAPFYKTSSTNASFAKKNGTFYIWGEGIENGRIRVTNIKENVGKKNYVSGWVSIDDLIYGTGSDFDNEVIPALITIDASKEFDSILETIFVNEIVELSVVEEA